jgi:hypothetical protein
MSHLAYLSKSDFKTGRDCPAKLWYKKRRYPSANEANDFLEHLAEQGHLVGKIAQMRYPDGHLIDTLDLEEAASQTAKLLKEENVVIFEPLVAYGPLLARVDVLVKRGKQCQLIEVKAKKAPERFTSKAGDKVVSKWLPYVEDIAFQLMVARAAWTDLEFTPYLMLTDGSACVDEARLSHCFEIRHEGRNCEVDFTGSDAQHEKLIALLTLHDVTQEVELLAAKVAAGAGELLPNVEADAPHPEAPLTSACAKCEYRVAPDVQPNGFLECWGELAEPDPHIFDLYSRDKLKGAGNKVVNQMIAEGRTGLFDVRDEEWNTTTDRFYPKRQQIQLQCMRTNTEWIDPALKDKMEAAPYPLQFIDFEFDRPAVPHVPGTAPWDCIAFQWSLHRIAEPGAACEHFEFLDTESDDPHPAFLESLKNALDLNGSVLIWSGAENWTLRDLVTGRDAEGMQDWINRLISPSGPLIDMEQLTIQHHFHPAMKGQTTVKKTFPPAWRGCEAVTRLSECADFREQKEDGSRKDPYKLLAERHPDFPVADGTAAILAYHALLDGKLSPEAGTTLRGQLLDYCRLDTLAMRVIWQYWAERLEEC